jgi:hypothetical protein
MRPLSSVIIRAIPMVENKKLLCSETYSNSGVARNKILRLKSYTLFHLFFIFKLLGSYLTTPQLRKVLNYKKVQKQQKKEMEKSLKCLQSETVQVLFMMQN